MSAFSEKLTLLFSLDNKDFTDNMQASLAQMEVLRMSVNDMIAPIEELSNEMLDLSSDYETALANVNTLLNDNGQQIAQYREQILELSKQVPQSANELADGLYQVISAGVDASDAIEFLGVASKSAVGGLSDTYTAVDALTTIINSYNMSAKDAQKISDQMFQTVKLGKVTYGELASQMGMLAPMAAQAGVSITDMLAAVATTSKKLKPEQTFTGLSQAIMQIMTPASKVDKAFQKFGFESGKAAMKSLGLQGALLKLKESGANLFDVFDTRSAKAVMALTASSEVARADLESVGKAAGAGEEAYKKIAETDEQVSILLRNNMDALKISMTDKFLPIITDFKKKMIGVLGGLNKMPDSLKAVGGGMIFAASATGKLMDKTVSLGRNIVALRQTMAMIKHLRIGEHFKSVADAFKKAQSSAGELDGKIKGMSKGAISLKGAIGAAGLGMAIAFTTGEIIKLVGAIKDWQKAEAELEDLQKWAQKQAKKQVSGLTEEQIGIVYLKTTLKDLQQAYKDGDEERIKTLKQELIALGIEEKHIKNATALLRWRTHLAKVAAEQGTKFHEQAKKMAKEDEKITIKKNRDLENTIALLKLYGIEFHRTGKNAAEQEKNRDKDLAKAKKLLAQARKKAEKDRADFEAKIEKYLLDNTRKNELEKLKGTQKYYEKLEQYRREDLEKEKTALQNSVYYKTASEEEKAKMVELLENKALADIKNIEKQKTNFIAQENQKRIDAEKKHYEQVMEFYVALGETMSSAIGEGIAGSGDAFKNALKQILTMTLDYIEKRYLLAKANTIIEAILTSGGSLIKGAPMLIAGHLAIQAAKAAIASFDEGAIIEKSGLAIVHKDEAIMNVNRMADVLSAVMAGRGQSVSVPNEFRIVLTDEDGNRLYKHAIVPAQQRYNRQFE